MDVRRTLAGLVAVLTAAVPTHAQQLPVAGDTMLARLTVEAIAANPGIARLAAQAQAAGYRVRPAGALPDPGFSVMLMDLTLPNFRFRESDFTEVDLEARQEFPWPGTQRARTRAATAISEERRADLGAWRREIAVRTAARYHRMRYLVAAREILQSQRALLEASLEIATARYASGSVPQTDPLAARAAVARLGTQQAALEAEEREARAALAALRGIVAPESLAVAPLRSEDVLAFYPSLEAHPHGGPGSLEQHPFLQARRAAITAAEETARAEGLGARPDIEVMVRYGMRPIAADFFTTGLGFRVPLWAGRKQKQLAEAARQEARAERAALAGEHADLVAELDGVLARARAGIERLRLLVAEVIPSVEAEREAALRNYRVGQIEFRAVLMAEQSRYDARLEAAETAAETLTLLVRLEQLTREEDLR